MEQIPGVRIQFFVDGEDVLVDEDGYVGRVYLPGQRAIIEAKVQVGSHGYGLSIDGNKNVVFKRDWLSYEDEEGKGRLFKITVPFKTSNLGVPHTEYPANTLRMLEAYRDGRVQIWTISLVSQEGDFFLVTHKQYEVRCCYRMGAVYCPYFETPPHSWPQLIGVLQSVFADVGVDGLPSRFSIPETEKFYLEGHQGRGMFWSPEQQWGMVQTTEGTARVHWTQVPRRPRRAFLVPGETVLYTELRTPLHQKPPAGSAAKERRTSFQKEAVGVRLLHGKQ